MAQREKERSRSLGKSLLIAKNESFCSFPKDLEVHSIKSKERAAYFLTDLFCF